MFLTSMLVTFFSAWLLLTHLQPSWRRRLVGYAGWTDVIVHGTVLAMFLGTSTHGLLQAEGAAIMFSLWLRAYRWAWGYERVVGTRWVRFTGRFTGDAA
jgi:hypothetical protein